MTSRLQPRPSLRGGIENVPPSEALSGLSETCHTSYVASEMNNCDNNGARHGSSSISAPEVPPVASKQLHQPQQDEELPACNSGTSPVAKRDIRRFATRKTPPTEGYRLLSPLVLNSGAGGFAVASTEKGNHQSLESPVPESSSVAQHHPHLLTLSYSSSSSFETDTSSDFSLTPPASNMRSPLLLSAKRHGNEVRQQHSKRRRRRTRRPANQASSSIAENVAGTTGSYDDDTGPFFGSWNGDDHDIAHGGSLADASSPGSGSAMLDSSEEDEPHQTMLPFPYDTKGLSTNEAIKQYWEWCYGKGTTIQLPLHAGAFSAARVPPLKGW